MAEFISEFGWRGGVGCGVPAIILISKFFGLFG